MKKLLAIFTIIAMTGCVSTDLEKVVKIPTTTTVSTPEEISTPLPKICKDAEANRVAASDAYNGKGFSTSGKVVLISDGFKPRYRILIEAGDITIHAGTNDKAAVSSLAVESDTEVYGVITDVTVDYSGCSITLANAVFS